MVNEYPKEKKPSTWNEAEWGPLAYKVFTECPHCGCPARYSVEALRGEMPEEKMQAKPPAIGSFEYIYDTALYRIKLTVVLDSCCQCGTLYTVARSRRKAPLSMIPRGRDMPPLMRSR